MPCFKPLHGYRSIIPNESGKYSIVFKPRQGYIDLLMDVPCGRCIGCRKDRVNSWMLRCLHEASLYKDNCFITLTYNKVPEGGSLVKKDFQDFMKRLRKRFCDHKIRFFHCGEYGDNFNRPHYHACLFNFDFPDKFPFKKKGKFQLYRSPTLEKLWPWGYSAIGDVTQESAAYVAGYVNKKLLGKDEDLAAHYQGRLPEYVTMSRRPGIASEWFKKYSSDVYPGDCVVVKGGIKFKPPRYYDEKYILINPESMLELKNKRLKDAKENPENEWRRRRDRHKVMRANARLKRRNFESNGI